MGRMTEAANVTSEKTMSAVLPILPISPVLSGDLVPGASYAKYISPTHEGP